MTIDIKKPADLMPLTAPGGSVVWVSPDVLLQQRVRKERERTAFFENFRKSVRGGGGSGIPAGGDEFTRGTAFTSGVRTMSTNVAGALEKPRDTPNFAFLRTMRRQSPIDALIIKIRLDQVRSVARRSMNPRRQAGWRVRHKFADDPNFTNTDDIAKRCLEMETLIEQGLNPTWHPNGLRGALISLVEDELAIDRKVIALEGLDRRGRPNGYHLLPPETIFPRLDAILPEMARIAAEQRSPITAIAQPGLLQEAVERVSDRVGLDLSDKAYVQIVEGRIVGAWEPDEIGVDYVYGSTELNRFGFGISPLEQSLWFSLSALLSLNYNADLFKQNYPEAVMFLFGDYDPEGLETFKKLVLQDTEAGSNWRLPVIPGGNEMRAEVQKLRDTPQDMLFTQWIKMLVAWKCAAYRMNPELVNFDLVHGADQTLFMQGSNAARITLSQEEGFQSCLDSRDDFLTRVLIAPYYDDLCFQTIGLNSMSELEETQMRIQQMNYTELGEVRAATGTLPVLTGRDADLNDRILNPVAIQLRAQEHQQEMAEQQLELQAQQVELQAKELAISTGGGGSDAPPSAGGRQHRVGGSASNPKTSRAKKS